MADLCQNETLESLANRMAAPGAPVEEWLFEVIRKQATIDLFRVVRELSLNKWKQACPETCQGMRRPARCERVSTK
jgi:hypothetical protein